MKHEMANKMLVFFTVVLFACLWIMGCALADVVIPDGVIVIEEEAFYGDTSVTSVILPDTVESIGDRAFANSGLTHIRLSSGLTYISPTAFEGIEYLEVKAETGSWADIWWEENKVLFGHQSSISEEYFQFSELNDGTVRIDKYIGVDDAKDLIIPKYINGKPVTIIGDKAFQLKRFLNGSLTIPNSVKTINEYAFDGCISLMNITIPDSVTSIGDTAFGACTTLTSISIPNSVTNIGDHAFMYCESLASITIPNSVINMGNFVFYGCESLIDITIPNSISSIGDYTFEGCSSLTNITIPDSITSIGNSAFSYCDNLTSIIIPDCVTSIGDGVFEGCRSLMNIMIPNGITNFGFAAFRFCHSLTGISIPDSVTNIGDCAFEGCESLIEITMPDSVTSIGFMAFRGCISLSNIQISNNVTTIEDETFSECTSLLSIDIPDNVVSISPSAFEGCCNMISINVGSNNTAYISHDGVLYDKNGSILIFCPRGKKEINILYSVESIDDWAFFHCTKLENLFIPESVTSIGYPGFAYCTSLISVKIPENASIIGNAAFSNCTSLIDISIPDNVTVIGSCEEAFYNCISLTNISLPHSVTSIGRRAFQNCVALKSVEIPNGVKTISEAAFNYCTNLTNVTIPNSVTNIGNAFQNCSSLLSIVIPNSVQSIATYVFYGCTSMKVIIIPDNFATNNNTIFSGCDASIHRYSTVFGNLYLYVTKQNVKPGETFDAFLNNVDPTNMLEYRYEIWYDDVLVQVRDWDTDSAASFVMDEEGEYSIRGFVKIGTYIAELKSENFIVGYMPVELSVHPSALRAITGEKITFFTNCTGGSGNYEYKFELYYNAGFINSTEWNRYHCASAYLQEEGIYYLVAWVHDILTQETHCARTDDIVISDSLQNPDGNIINSKEEALVYLNNSYNQFVLNVNHSFVIYYLQTYEENIGLRISSGIYKALIDPTYTWISGPDKSEIYENIVRDYLNLHTPNYHKPYTWADDFVSLVSNIKDEYKFLKEPNVDVNIEDGALFSGIIAVLQGWVNLAEDWNEIDLLLQNTDHNLNQLDQLRIVYSASPEMINAIESMRNKIYSGLPRMIEELKDYTSPIIKWALKVGYDLGLNFSIVKIEEAFGAQALSPALFTAKAWNVLDKVYDIVSGGDSVGHYIEDNLTLIAKCEAMLDLQDIFAAYVMQDDWESAMLAVDPYYDSVLQMYEFFRDMSWNHYEAMVEDDISQLNSDYRQFRNMLNAYNAFP